MGRWSRIDMNGIKVTSPSLDTVGFFARCAPDLQLLANVFGIKSPPLGTDARAINSCKFAFVKTDQFEQHASEDLQLVWELAQTILIEAGAKVGDVDLDHGYDNMGNSYEICDEQVATSLLAEHRINPDKLSAGLQKMVKTGGGISHKQAQIYRDHIATLRPKFDRLSKEYDAIITPSCAGEAPEKGDFDPETKFCGLWTALHVPVIAVPGVTGSNGLPIGLSLVGPRYVVALCVYAKLTFTGMEMRNCCRLLDLSPRYLGRRGPDGRGKYLSPSVNVIWIQRCICRIRSLPIIDLLHRFTGSCIADRN